MEFNNSSLLGEKLEDRYFRSNHELRRGNLCDISQHALWTVSSYKKGHGVNKLFDDEAQTYWQSDATMPHTIAAKFSKLTSIKQFSMFLPTDLDESYTPKTVSLLAGTGAHDMIQCGTWDLADPVGWCDFIVDHARGDHVLKCFELEICINENHQNGKDSRVRAIKVYSEIPKKPLPARV